MKIFTLFKHLRKPVLFSLLALCCLMMKSEVGLGQTVVVNPTSPWIVPAGVTSIKVEVWGGGGAGGAADGTFFGLGSNIGSSGGGGAYNIATWSVSSGQSYTVVIGSGGSGGSGNGGNGTATTVSGPGGSITGNAGTGGRENYGVAGSGGSGVFNGGNGAVGSGSGNASGGGGGAGNNGSGGMGSTSAAGVGGAANPNTAPYLGGNGGANRSNNGPGNAGISPGGGGGGARSAGSSTSYSGGGGAIGQVVITYYNTPTITSFSPNNACSGSGITITIQGTNFTNPSTVKINGITATSTFVNNTTLTAVLPSGATTGAISVSTAGGTATSATNFTVNPLPATTLVSGGGSFCATSATLTASGGSGGTIYFQGTTSNGTSTAIPSNTQIITASGTYYFRAQSSSGCWGPQGSATVNINTVPAATTVSGAGTFCGSTTVTASGGSGGTIYFQGMVSGGTSTSIASNSQTVTASGTYYFRSRSAAGCWGPEGSVVVSITPIPPAPTGSTPQLFCSNNNPTVSNLSATGSNIQWYSAATGSTALTSSTALIDGNHYYASQTVSGCESTTRLDVTVNVYDAVNIITQPDITQTSCSTFPADFTVAATGSGLTYQWYKVGSPDAAVIDDGNITGSTTDHLHIDQTSTTDAGTYYVMVSGTSPCDPVRSGDATLIVNEEIVVVSKPANQTVCEGATSVTFTVVATGTDLTYQWKKGSTVLADDAHISGSGTASLTINNITLADASNNYNVVISSLTGICPQSNPKNIKLIVNPTPSILDYSTNTCSGNSVTYTPANGLGNTVLSGTTYTWSAPTVPGISGTISGTSQSSFNSGTLINSTNTPINVVYNVTPTTTTGSCSGNAFNITITVNPSPVITNQTGSVCSGGVFSFTPVNGSPTSATIVPSNTTYSWNAPASVTGISGLSGGTAQTSFNATLINSTNAPITVNYTVTPTSGDAGNCVGASFNIALTVNPTPAIPDQAGTTCSGVTYTLLLSNGVPTAATVIPFNTKYSWTAPAPVTGISGLTGGTAQTAFSVSLTNSTSAPITVNYTVTPTSGAAGSCVGVPFNVAVTVNPTPTLSSTLTPAAVCSNTAFVYTPTSNISPITFGWTRAVVSGISNPGASGSNGINETLINTTGSNISVRYVYTLTSNGCTNTQNVDVIIKASNVTVAPAVQPPLCNNSSTTAMTISSSVAGTTFSWSRDNTANITGISSGSGTNIPAITLTNTTTTTQVTVFTITATAPNGCVITKTVSVAVYATLVPGTVTADQVLCNLLSTSTPAPLNSTPATGGSGNGTYTYVWQQSLDLTNWTTATGNTGTLTYQPPAIARYYRLGVVDNTCGDKFSNTVTISTATELSGSFDETSYPTSAFCYSGGSYHYMITSGSFTSGIGNKTIDYSWSSSYGPPTVASTGIATTKGTCYLFGLPFLPYDCYTGDATFTFANSTNAVINTYVAITPKVLNTDHSLYCQLDTKTIPIDINPNPVVNTILNAQYCNGTVVPATSFTTPTTGGTMSYTWTNSNTAIGLAASGSTAYIPSFTATNNGTNPITSTVKVTPSITYNGTKCTNGTPMQFTINVNPTPKLSSSLTPPAVCSGSPFNYTALSLTTGTSFSWSRAAVAGISNAAASGTNGISETLINTTSSPITVTYVYNLSANTCSNSQNVTVSVNPTPAISDYTSTICSGSTFTIAPANEVPTAATIVPLNTKYTWTVSAPNITGASNQITPQTSISQTLTNTTSTVQTATYTVTPISGASGSCTGSTFTISVNVNPTPDAGTITGSSSLCVGTQVIFSSSVSGGTWVSSNPSIVKVVDPINGITQGLSTGAANITYQVSISGCGSATSPNYPVTVTPAGEWKGITSNWNDPQNWCSGIPTSSTNVIIPSGVPNQPKIYTADANAKSVTINSGASLTMSGAYNLNIASSGIFTNNGNFDATASTTGAVVFAGNGTVNGGSATSFNNLTMNSNLTLPASPTASTITGTFKINSGSVLTNSPVYTSTSTLVYNTGASYTTGREWFAGSTTIISAGIGIPQNVIIQSGTVTVNTGSNANRSLAGDLTINSGSLLQLLIGSNPNLTVTGNWTNNGTFSANGKTVTFNGGGDNILAGNTTFHDLTINKTGGFLTFAAQHTTIDHDLTVSGGAMKSNTNTMVEFTGIGSLAGINDKSFYDLQINNASVMTITSGGVSINHDFINNGIYTYNGAARLTTFGGSGILQSMSGSAGSTTIFGKVVVGDNHPFSTGITLNASNDYTIQGGSISLSHSSTLNNTGNTVSFSGSAATISTTGTGIAYFHDAVTNVSLNPGSGISTFNNYLQINPGGSIAVNSPNYGGAATLIYNTATPSLTTGLEWNANSATPDLGQPFNVAIQNTNNIVMDGDRTVPGTLNIGSVNTLSLNDKMLTVNKAIDGAGSLTGSLLSGLTLGGSAPALNFTQTGSGNYLKTFTLNSGSSATLANALNIAAGVSYTNTGVLKADGPLNANGLLTLKSDANGDARIDISSAAITGEVTVERYIPARRAWRFLSVPFANTNQTINQAWQEGQTITSVTCPPSDPTPAGLGTQLAYINGYPGYDYHSTSNPSLQYWNNTAWAAPPSTIGSNKLTDHHSWYVFVRGDRHICLDGINGDNITTLRSKGTLNQIGGINQRLQLSPAGMAANNFFMVGNPYASPINLETIVNASRVNGFYADKVWVMDPKVSGNNGVGGYVTWTKGVGWVPNDPAGITASYNLNDPAIIQSGQGFMVYSSGTNAQVQFLEQDKVMQEANVYGIGARRPKYPVIFTNLTKTGGKEMIDGVAAAFDAGLSASVDEKDVQKLWNPGENIALIRDNQGLSVEKRPLAGKSDTLFYRLYLRQQPYALSIFSGSFPQQDLPAYAWLIDKYLQKQIAVNLKDTTVYNFTPNADTNSYRNRFMLVFNVKAKPNADSFIYKVKARIYPNPVNGKTFNLELQNGQKGKYTINIFTSSGRLVATRTLNYEYRQDTYTIHVPATIVAGNYIVQVMDSADKAVSAISLIISK